MLLNNRQLLGISDQGIPLVQLNNFIQGKSPLFEEEFIEVEIALTRVIGEKWLDYIHYARENRVVYSL